MIILHIIFAMLIIAACVLTTLNNANCLKFHGAKVEKLF
jgi:hypothetical protein